MQSLLVLCCLSVVIERKISVRSTRNELIQRGILKNDEVGEGNQLPATTGPVGDSGIVSGEIIFLHC